MVAPRVDRSSDLFANRPLSPCLVVLQQQTGHWHSPTLSIYSYHAKVAGRANPHLALDGVLGVDVDAGDHRGAPDVDHPGDRFDDLPGVDRCAEVNALAGCCDERPAAKAERSNGC